MAVLEAAGRLLGLGRVLRLELTARAVLEREIPSLDFGALDDAGVELLMAIELARNGDEDEAKEAMNAAAAALSTCQRFALLWKGAECLGLSGSFSADAQASRLSFEQLLEQQLSPDGARLNLR